MQLNLPEFGKSSQVVRRPDNNNNESSSSSSTSYCGTGFPLPFGGLPGLTDMASSCQEDVLLQYKHINLPNVSSRRSSLKELTDPSKLNLRKRARPCQTTSGDGDIGGDGGKQRQRRRLEDIPSVFGHLAAIRRKQCHMESCSQVVPASPCLSAIEHPLTLHTTHSTSPIATDTHPQQYYYNNKKTATPTKPDHHHHSIHDQPFIPSYHYSPAVGGSNQFSPVIIEGAHLVLPSTDETQSSYEPTVLADKEIRSDASFSVPGLFDESETTEEDNEDVVSQPERNESPFFRDYTPRHTFTGHPLTPYTTSPHTLHPSQESLLPFHPSTLHTHPTSRGQEDRLDVANFSIIRYCPREE